MQESPRERDLPHNVPRPPGEKQELERIWQIPTGWRILSAVNNSVIGLFYLGAAIIFFLLAGTLGLLIRVQLAVPENDFLGQDLYNQIFTMHGTTMMFLFAVPAVEALGVLLLPQILGARDLPFPRLGAFATWSYIIGGTVFFGTLFFDLAPRDGWFMYPPLTLKEYSPGDNADFWLLGIGFIEISAIAGAIEIIIGVLRTRAPGMSLARMPIFAWAMLIFAGMIVFAFPAVILATMLLEIERSFGWPFFSATSGGDPLLWQHLFWFFGHPEVYIIFLPAAGLVSMMVATMARHHLIGHELIVVALIATGFFSFGLWVHHMFTTGIPALSLGFFSAASMAVAVPSGIQVFSWMATIAAGHRRFRITTASLFILGFLFIFTLGGLTGVMVALVPVDFQLHDSYFVVAHFHYVLIGGMVFPLIATIYYWLPMVSRRALSERLGRWVFGLMFLGFNIAFLPMHWTGLLGMPRRVWTYPAGMGWNIPNLISSVGAFLFAFGIALCVMDVVRCFRPDQNRTGNPWGAGTLEWLPSGTYSLRSIPHVASREPLWDQPELAGDVAAGRYYLPDAPTGGRESLVTTPVEAEPDYVLRVAGPGWSHVFAAVFMAAFFLLLTVKWVVVAMACGIAAVVFCVVWAWQLDPAPGTDPIHIGGSIRLSTYVSGPRSHAWWAMVILVLVGGSLYLSYLFSYLYLWVVSPDMWALQGASALPAAVWPLGSGVLLTAGLLALAHAGVRLPIPGASGKAACLSLFAAGLLLAAALAIDLLSHWQSGLRPHFNAYGAMVYMGGLLNLQVVAAVIIMLAFACTRLLTGRLDRIRRVSFETMAILYLFAVGQSGLNLFLTHGFPRVVS
jgi:cytochrome c oxidase subunit I+III